MKHHNIWYTNTNKLLKTIVLLGKTNNKVDYDYIPALILSVSATIALPIWSLIKPATPDSLFITHPVSRVLTALFSGLLFLLLSIILFHYKKREGKMPEQQEFYNRLREETETKVASYQTFAKQLKETKDTMKFLAKQIEANNQMITLQGLEPVKFEK